jgi:Protein of unknown function (DUF3237)
MSERLPEPRLTKVFRLEADPGEVLDLGNVTQGRRRIVPLTPEHSPGLNSTACSCPEPAPIGRSCYQTAPCSGTSASRTDGGDLLYVRSQGVRHGSAEVLARLGRGEEVDASEYVFRISMQIEAAAPDLDWLNKGVFVSVGGRQIGGVIYEVFLVG